MDLATLEHSTRVSSPSIFTSNTDIDMKDTWWGVHAMHSFVLE
jgi:hypothetical protein